VTHDWSSLVQVVAGLLACALVAGSPWWLGGAAVRRHLLAAHPPGSRRSRGAGPNSTDGAPPSAVATTRGRRGRARPEAGTDVLVVLALLNAALASGTSVTRALVGVGDALGTDDGRALRTVGVALELGSAWQRAWIGLPAHLAEVRDCLHGSWASGSAAGPAIRAAAAQVRRRRRWGAREASGRLAVRLVLPLGLCFLPACLLLGLVPIVLSLARDLW
jgi:hypothetical protein